MKGYYVIWTEDTEEFTGKGCKARAIKRAKEIYNKGLDDQVFIQRFDDNNPDGYMAGEKTIYISDII